MRLEKTTRVADRVLAQIERILEKKSNAGGLWVETYKNGRENGYALIYSFGIVFRKIAFAENRNSDDIVLYKGAISDFSNAGNIPSAAIYGKRELIGGSKINKAAQIAVKFVLIG
jgi:hypothetical protein